MFRNIFKVSNKELICFRHLSNDCKVGFIGLGNMGAYMAVNLLNSGHKVVAFDKDQARIDHLKQLADGKKVDVARSIKELSSFPDLKAVITMLPSSPQVIAVYKTEGLLTSAPKNTVFIDCTTGDPAVSQDIGKEAGKCGCVYVDAPVSGGVNAARDGILTFMVGGTQSEVDKASILLKKMGKDIFHCGPIGTGLAAKICNNMLLAISMIGVSEAMNLGRKLGLEPTVLAKIINSSSGRCWSSDTYNPVPNVIDGVPSSRDYEGGFGVALMAKMNNDTHQIEKLHRRAQRFRTERDDEKAQHRLTRRLLLAAEDAVIQVRQRAISPSAHRKVIDERDALKEKWRRAMQQRDDAQTEVAKAQFALTELEQLVKSQGGLQYITQVMGKRKKYSRNSRQRRKDKWLKEMNSKPDDSASPIYEAYTLAPLLPPDTNPGLPARSKAPYIGAYALPLIPTYEAWTKKKVFIDLDG